MTATFERQATGEEIFTVVVTQKDIQTLSVLLTINDEEMIKQARDSYKASDKLRMLAYMASILEEHNDV